MIPQLVLAAVATASAASVASAFPNPLDTAPAALLQRLRESSHPAASRYVPDAATAPSYGVRVSPLDFGGDPLGVRDSAPALAQCVAACMNYSRAIDSLGHFPGDYSFGNGHYIANAGGCQIDLGGGQFMLSSPVLIPEYVGNLALGHGSLIADDRAGVFPPNSFLVVIGVKGSCNVPQGSCNVDLNFPELFLDGRHVASGMEVNNVMGTTIGPGAYLLNFSSYGVQVNGGHEVMIDRCWLGETNFDYPFTQADPPKAYAIQVNANDHYIANTVVFSSKVGVEINGAADYVTGTHVWFPENQALAFVKQGVMAFHVTGWQNRFLGCYIDGSRAVFEGGGLTNNVWMGGFECCAGVGGVPHGIELHGDVIGPGLVIADNIFCGGNIYHTPLADNKTAVLKASRIESNSFCGQGTSSRASQSLTQTAATSWSFDLCSTLVFANIERVSVSVVAASGFPIAVARPPVGCTVLVETSEPVTGTVTVLVDSSTLDPSFGCTQK